MSDAEVISSFMEPQRIEGRWWTGGKNVVEVGPEVWHRDAQGPLRTTIVTDRMVPHAALTLDALREVQERLTEEQWAEYASLMMDPAGVSHAKFLLHATAEQKIRALAAVLRTPEVPR